jgi:hypothetical protein
MGGLKGTLLYKYLEICGILLLLSAWDFTQVSSYSCYLTYFLTFSV